MCLYIKAHKNLKMNTDNRFNILRLIFLHIIGKATPLDVEQLNEWIGQSPENKKIVEKYKRGNFISKFSFSIAEKNKQQAFERLIRDITHYEARKRRQKIFYSVAAACILLFMSISVVLQQTEAVFISMPIAEMQYNKEVSLTTSDGEVVQLKSSEDGITVQNNAVIINNRGKINLKQADIVKKNVLTIPRGKDYMVTLSDGSKVWLNSESRLEFPSEFTNDERRVFIEGEAYFDIVKDNNRKFIVETTMGNIEVLGTTFNVSHYSGTKSVITTLVSGSVNFCNNGESVTLKPDEQCIFNGDKMTIHHVDASHYTSWTEGRYIFKDASLEEVVKVISRWFNIEVSINKNIIISGSFKRSDNIEEIINMINEVIEEPILTIKPN